jgi:hypothetical protein
MKVWKSKILSFLLRQKNIIIIFLSALIINRNSPFFNLRYSLLITLPLLRFLKRKYKKINISITHTGKLLIFNETVVLKLPFSKLAEKDLELEFNNYQKLKGFKYFNYSLKSFKGIYLMSKMQTMEVNPNFSFENIIQYLKKLPPKKSKPLSIEFILCFLEKNITEEFSKLRSQLVSKRIIYGPSHNDLTFKNIMLYKSNLAIIDLSKFEFRSFSNFDLLHNEIRSECFSKKINFFDLFKEDKKYHTGEYLFYFIYRVYFETKLGFSKGYKKSVTNCLNFITENINE